jgi:beta-aspartyl-peptidase (threonine type)
VAICVESVRQGLAKLDAGGSAVDAVQAAVRVMEDAPMFNAGRGSVLTRDRTIETEAAIMDGSTGAFGGVAAMPNCANPIEVARAVLEDGEHLLLCGEPAWAFARPLGYAPAAPADLITEWSLERFDIARAAATSTDPGTVGAVAVDGLGNTAAATSTGGISHKRRGRVGDTPLIGCGTYADRSIAASATGHGESLMRAMTTRRVAELCADAKTVQSAAEQAVRELAGAAGGVIVIDADGSFGVAHNTNDMPYAVGRLGSHGAEILRGEMRISPR